MIISRFGKLLFGLSVLSPLLVGCQNAVPVVTPELDQQMTQSLLDGKAVLDCHLGCSGSWGQRRQEFAQRNAAHDWHGLAIGVMQVGYQSDLSYFYLGRAAQGLGADEAAIRYYEIAAAIAEGSNTEGKCRGIIDTCDGIAMPYILTTLIQEAQADLAAKSAAAVPPSTSSPRHHTRKFAAQSPSPQQPSDIQLIDPPPVTR